MIADHDEDERCLLKAVLKLKGFRVIEATNGREAIELTIDKCPDLLVVDLRLPRVSGSAAIRQIRRRADFRNLPIVAVSMSPPWSGNIDDEGGSTVHINKPIGYDELDALIDRFLPGRRLRLAGA